MYLKRFSAKYTFFAVFFSDRLILHNEPKNHTQKFFSYFLNFYMTQLLLHIFLLFPVNNVTLDHH